MVAGRGQVMMMMMMIFMSLFMMMEYSCCMAQSSSNSCMNVIIGMASCLNYVTGSSKTPNPSCCSSLANVVQTQPRCLCTVLNGGASQIPGVNINTTLALQLPDACNVKTPPVSRCNEANNGPAMSPVGSPETSAAGGGGGGPVAAADGSFDSPTFTGSKASPGTTITPSSGNIVKKKNMNLEVGLMAMVMMMMMMTHVSKFSFFTFF